MDFDRIFEDLEGRLVHLEGEELRATSEELARAERAQVSLEDRLRAAIGTEVTVRLVDGTDVIGTLTETAPTWLGMRLTEGGRRALVPTEAIDLLLGIGVRARPAPESARASRTVRSPLRELARDREILRIRTRSGAIRCRIVAVGQDAIDVLSLPAGDGSGASSGSRMVIPTRSLCVVVVL